MPAKAVVFGFVFVMLIGITVFITEMVVPMSAKARLNTRCRSTLIGMEINGGLTQQSRN